jgi:hypothetical protein
MVLSQIEGEVVQAAAPALYKCNYLDGEIVSERVNPLAVKAPRGRFELPRDEPT